MYVCVYMYEHFVRWMRQSIRTLSNVGKILPENPRKAFERNNFFPMSKTALVRGWGDKAWLLIHLFITPSIIDCNAIENRH